MSKGIGRRSKGLMVAGALATALAVAPAQSVATRPGQQPVTNPPVRQPGVQQPGGLVAPPAPRDVANWPNLDIPEFHDSQRFDSAGTFGAFVRAFAPVGSPTPTRLFAARWVSVGVVLVDTWTKVVDRSAAVAGMPFSISPTTGLPPLPAWPVYTRLGLVPGWNCVYVRPKWIDVGSGRIIPGAWSGAIAPPVRGSCNLDVGTEPAGSKLPVVVSTANGPNSGSARIIELAGRMRAFGFPCGTEWCAVGANTADLLPSAHAGITSAPKRPQWRHASWYDDQILATVSSEQPYGLTPGLRSSVIPDTGLANYHVRNAFSLRAVHVGTVWMDKNVSGKYREKWGFAPGLNEVYLRTSEDGRVWQAFMRSPRGDSIPLKVTRHDHTPFHDKYGVFPAVARWAWVDNDELVWIECDYGCCLIEPGRS